MATMLDMNGLVAQAYERTKSGCSEDDVAGFLQEHGIEPSAAYGIADAQAKLVQQEKFTLAAAPIGEPVVTPAPVATPQPASAVPSAHPAVEFIGTLFNPDDRLCVVLIDPICKQIISDFRSAEQVCQPEYLQRLGVQNQQRNVYVGMNPILAGHKNRTKPDIAGIRTVYLDLDSDAQAKLKAINESGLVPEPTFVLRSSDNKYQVIWRLAGVSQLEQESLLAALISQFGGDPACKDCTRVFRLPGFANLKYANRPIVAIVQRHSGIYRRDDFNLSSVAHEERKLPVTASSDGPRVPRGSHDSELIRIAGKLRADGLEYDEILPILIRNVEQRFDDVGSDWIDMCEKKAASACRYPKGDGSIPLAAAMQDRIQSKVEQQKQQPIPYETGQPIPPGYTVQASGSGADRVEYLVKIDDEPEPDIDDSEVIDRPEFPRFVMEGTSLYENLVKPAIAASDKHPELIFMPAVLMFLNYISGRVHIKGHTRNPNLFLGIISPYGQFFKSSSCKAAQGFFKLMGCATDSSERTASGKTVIIAPGSTEGLGTSMKKISGDHAVLYYDELSKLVDKAGIEHSSFCSDLLTFYDSGLFENVIKKESFSFPADTYCFSWLFCTTDRKFLPLWAKLPNADSGLNDRMFFMLSPQQPKPTHVLGPQPTFIDGALRTKQLIDKAFNHNNGNYEYEDWNDLQSRAAGLNPRAMEMLQDLALYFAIDLNLDVIDIDAAERALALVKYRNDVMAFLSPDEGENTQARLQMAMVRELRLHHGKISYRELKNILHAARKGTDVWDRAINGLIHDKRVLLREARCGKAGEQRLAMVYLLKQQD